MVSQEDFLADAESSDYWAPLDQDGLDSSTGAGGHNKSLANSQMLSPNKTPSLVRSAEDDDQKEAPGAKDPRIKSAQSRLLRVPPTGGNERLVETSIWDWDAPLESVGDSASSYYFEPVGELLQEQGDQHSARSEFHIPQPVARSGMSGPSQAKRDSDNSEGFAIPRRPTSNAPSTAGVKRKSDSDPSTNSSRPADKRLSRMMSEPREEQQSVPEPTATVHSARSQSNFTARGQSGAGIVEQRQRASTISDSRRPSVSTPGTGTEPRRTATDPSTLMALPSRKVFPIQIGSQMFRLSGASISSDAPSYFSQFFEEQLRQNEGANVRTLYIDRDPKTFEDVALHLQGYHIEPRDGPHFVKLFADAQFFSLPRLTAQLLQSTIYIRIGDEEFQIPRDIFSNPGDTPNYFSLGFSTFFTTPTDVFPGLSERAILRPPPILPPSIPNKSAKTFADLLHVLKGYPLEIRSEEHRQELLRDAKYFHLKGLEQRLIKHNVSYNLVRKQCEIVIRLEDIRQSGLSYQSDNMAGATPMAASPASSTVSNTNTGPGWVHYQRPYVDSEAYSLIVEIGGDESTFLSVDPGSASSRARSGRATFHRQTLARITSLFSVIASKMNLPITQPLGLMMLERGAGVASLPVSPSNTGMSEDRVKVRIGLDAEVVVDGKPWFVAGEDREDGESASGRKKRRQRSGDDDDDDDDDDGSGGEEWVVRQAQWRVRVQATSGEVGSGRSGLEVILGAVKIEAFSNERERNAGRGFLS